MTRFLPRLLTLALFLIAPLGAMAHDTGTPHGVTIESAWARKTSRTVSGAVYLAIRNDGTQMEELLDADSEIAESTMIHRSYEEDGVMRMDHVMSVPIAPGETFALTPGGYHIMLMGLEHPLEEGSTFPITLTFKQAGEVQVIVEVTGMMGPQ